MAPTPAVPALSERADVPDIDVLETGPDERLPHGAINPRASIPFFAVHLLPLLAIFTGVPASVWVLFAVTYWVRMFFITAGYHRYFAHKTYKTSRAFQFILAVGGCSAVQKGPLWWAGHHRIHHRYTDTIDDPHTPRKGFWWSHAGWILTDETSPLPDGIMKDFEQYPEIRFISRHDWIAPWGLALICFLIGGLPGLLIGFFLSTVVLWHSTFLINSLAHVFGSRQVRHRRHLTQQPGARHPHDGRGVAQQPPQGCLRGPPGTPVVGGRPHLVRPRRAREAARHLGREASPRRLPELSRLHC